MTRTQRQALFDDSSAVLDEEALAAGYPSASFTLVAHEHPLDGWRYKVVKRLVDVCFALLMLIVFFIPGLIIAALIRLTSPYPIFYREERIGRHGIPFRIWKFRSMRPHTANRPASRQPEHAVLQWRIKKQGHDPRVTPVGRFLRRWSLDEIPQVLNVLRGEMSLIGPRPIVKAETYFYRDLLPLYLAATPGLSGLWQVSGRSDLDYDERARLDATYVRTWSLWLDASIFLRTVPAVLSRVGAR